MSQKNQGRNVQNRTPFRLFVAQQNPPEITEEDPETGKLVKRKLVWDELNRSQKRQLARSTRRRSKQKKDKPELMAVKYPRRKPKAKTQR
jgi:hypothetical protein